MRIRYQSPESKNCLHASIAVLQMMLLRKNNLLCGLLRWNNLLVQEFSETVAAQMKTEFVFFNNVRRSSNRVVLRTDCVDIWITGIYLGKMHWIKKIKNSKICGSATSQQHPVGFSFVVACSCGTARRICEGCIEWLHNEKASCRIWALPHWKYFHRSCAENRRVKYSTLLPIMTSVAFLMIGCCVNRMVSCWRFIFVVSTLSCQYEKNLDALTFRNLS